MGPRAESYDLFLCHAWDDRRETATELHDLLEAAAEEPDPPAGEGHAPRSGPADAASGQAPR